MKKIRVIALLGYCVIGWLNFVFAQADVWQEISRGNLDLKTVLVDFKDSRIIYAGTKNAILKTEDGAETWRSILSIRGENKAVNFLLFDPQDNNSLYAATGNGLFYSNNRGGNWKRIFKGKNYLQNQCTAVRVSGGGIYLGTRQGLFISKDRGQSWHKPTGRLRDACILAIALDAGSPNYIYIACVDGVFKTKDGGQFWERIFITNPTEDGNDMEEATEDQDEAGRFSNLRYIGIDPNNPDYLYLATSRGVYKSQDRGQMWELVSSYGLLSQDVRFLFVSGKSDLYAATKSGVFEYKNERWQELSLGLAAEEIKSLSIDNQGNLYAACDKGLFKLDTSALSYGSNSKDDIISLYSKDEPDISKVQQAAIKYAEVGPEKILRWRKQAAKRAMLPKVTVGMDRDKNKTISKSIWGIYSSYTNGNETTPGRYYIGPDDETRYDNKNWGVSLTWDLGELIWNQDQTSIDVRSRLMVQLRQDVLDEVTKLYFERIRLKMELDNLSIEDRKKRLEKELRLRELTAQIDGLTDGYFSNNKKG